MEFYLDIVVMVALAAAFCVLLVKKWGIAEYVQVHGDRYLSQMFGCDLCMSFWASVIITIAVMCVTNDMRLIFVPVFATPVTRMLV